MRGMRFRPRFSLKMLLLLVAVVGAICAYHVNWIRQRHALLAKYAALKSFCEDATWRFARPATQRSSFLAVGRQTPKGSAGGLWLFGEPTHGTVMVVIHTDRLPSSSSEMEQCSSDDRALAEELFPEAQIELMAYGSRTQDHGGYRAGAAPSKATAW